MLRFCAFFGLLLYTSLSVFAQTNLVHPKYLKGETYAVVVGISDYVDDRLDLTVADKDALAIGRWLRNHGFPKLDDAHLNLLTNQQATKANIILALQKVARSAGPDDRIIFYFSGHGAPEGLASADYRLSDGGNLLQHETVKTILKLSRSTQTLLIVDACHAGGSESAMYFGIFTDLKNGYLNSGISMLLSSDISQSSLEYPAVGMSYFTHYLLQGIEKGYANTNKDNLITIDEAYDYVRLNVQVLTDDQQTPTKGGDFDPSIVMRLY